MKKLKLNKLAENRLNEKEMGSIKGGALYAQVIIGGRWVTLCGCACAYANNGGSSENSNFNANYNSRLFSPQLITSTTVTVKDAGAAIMTLAPR